MLKLEKIVLQGFKSFKRKASIPLPTGISVITGPNGGGKSNITDGIYFVLGKSSRKTLRTKKLQDLIFHGSKNKEASEWANVSLYFDNSSRALPFEDGTVSIGRKVNQNGVSTFRLNGKVVTRQQIVDVLSQGGIRPGGHNIIQQGDVNQVVEMDATERAEMINEISGIMEYDEKKQKAEKILEKIEQKIRESEAVLAEKTKIFEDLKSESEAAMEWQKLNDDLEKVRAAIRQKSYSNLQNTLKEVREKLASKKEILDSLQKEVRNYDSKIETEMEKFDKFFKQASKGAEVTENLGVLRSEIGRKRDKIQANKDQIEQLMAFKDKITLVGKNPAAEKVLSFKGVFGRVSDLIIVPPKYRTAVEVSAGWHLQDVVVDSTATAVSCIKYLKQNMVGRARFLPLDKIKSPGKGKLPSGAIGWLSELVHHDQKYTPVVDYLFGRTAAVNDIDRAKKIAESNRIRMVTLDGDLIEASGALYGGYYQKKSPEVSKYAEQIKKLQAENKKLESDLKQLEKEEKVLAEQEKKTKGIGHKMGEVKAGENLEKMREKRSQVYNRMIALQNEIAKLNEKATRAETKLEDFGEVNPGENLEPFIHQNISILRQKESDFKRRIEEIGAVNQKAPEKFERFKTEFEDFREKVDKILSEKASIEEAISKIEAKRFDAFMSTLNEVAKHFKRIYFELTGGDAQLTLEEPDNIESGLSIKACPPGKKLKYIDSMSGGEKTLTAFTFLFAIQMHKPAPFYVLDEADANLDPENTKRVVELIKKYSKNAQFIIISHNNIMIRAADQVYGISMHDGESKVMGMKLPEN